MNARQVLITLAYIVLLHQGYYYTKASYCDCTSNYTASLPNGSHCPNTTYWDPVKFNCTENITSGGNISASCLIVGQDYAGNEISGGATTNYTVIEQCVVYCQGYEAAAGTVCLGVTWIESSKTCSPKSALAALSVKATTNAVNMTCLADEITAAKAAIVAANANINMTLYNYTAYDATTFPLNSSCPCNCSQNADNIYSNNVNRTDTTQSSQAVITVSDGVTTTTTTTVTVVTNVQGPFTVTATTTSVVVEKTEDGITSSKTSSETATTNVTSSWTDTITVVGQCIVKTKIEGLHCYNCIFIPSMAKFNVCIEDNENCPGKCIKSIYKHLGIEYYIASCAAQTQPTWNCTTTLEDGTTKVGDPACNANTEYCDDRNYCNSWIPGRASYSSISTELVLLVLAVAAHFNSQLFYSRIKCRSVRDGIS